jgi:uncharacterized protein
MKRLTTTLCLTLAVLLGSAGMSAGADFQKGLAAYDSGDYATALREFRPLAEEGDVGAQLNLGLMYARGEGVTQDYKAAVMWLTRAAEQGDIAGQFILGAIYMTGEGVTQDYKAAVKWLTLAAKQGSPLARSKLKDIQKELFNLPELHRRAEQGDPSAQFDLSRRYFEGDGVARDVKSSIKWLTLGAEQGDPVNQYILGKMYARGRGVPQDYKATAKWFTRAAEQGLARAQYKLAKLYGRGNGVLKDYVYAYMWASVSTNSANFPEGLDIDPYAMDSLAQGNRHSAKLRDSLEKKMSPSQIADAQKLARECVRKKYKGC